MAISVGKLFIAHIYRIDFIACLALDESVLDIFHIDTTIRSVGRRGPCINGINTTATKPHKGMSMRGADGNINNVLVYNFNFDISNSILFHFFFFWDRGRLGIGTKHSTLTSFSTILGSETTITTGIAAVHRRSTGGTISLSTTLRLGIRIPWAVCWRGRWFGRRCSGWRGRRC